MAAVAATSANSAETKAQEAKTGQIWHILAAGSPPTMRKTAT